MMANEAVEEYRSSLSDLTFNSKPLINMLTMLADDSQPHAAQIVQVIEAHIQKTKVETKLPAMYLIDSILKNVNKSTYSQLFAQNIVAIFSHVFEKVDEKTRQSLFKLRQTWNTIFPTRKLYAIDVRVNTIDPAWPITAAAPESPVASIHVNPLFIKPQEEEEEEENEEEKKKKKQEEEEAKMRQQLIAKQAELLKLQQQRLELELADTKAKLEKQRKETASVFAETDTKKTTSSTASTTMTTGVSQAAPPAVAPAPSRRDPRLASAPVSRDPRLSRATATASSTKTTSQPSKAGPKPGLTAQSQKKKTPSLPRTTLPSKAPTVPVSSVQAAKLTSAVPPLMPQTTVPPIIPQTAAAVPTLTAPAVPPPPPPPMTVQSAMASANPAFPASAASLVSQLLSSIPQADTTSANPAIPTAALSLLSQLQEAISQHTHAVQAQGVSVSSPKGNAPEALEPPPAPPVSLVDPAVPMAPTQTADIPLPQVPMPPAPPMHVLPMPPAPPMQLQPMPLAPPPMPPGLPVQRQPMPPAPPIQAQPMPRGPPLQVQPRPPIQVQPQPKVIESSVPWHNPEPVPHSGQIVLPPSIQDLRGEDEARFSPGPNDSPSHSPQINNLPPAVFTSKSQSDPRLSKSSKAPKDPRIPKLSSSPKTKKEDKRNSEKSKREEWVKREGSRESSTSRDSDARSRDVDWRRYDRDDRHSRNDRDRSRYYGGRRRSPSPRSDRRIHTKSRSRSPHSSSRSPRGDRSRRESRETDVRSRDSDVRLSESRHKLDEKKKSPKKDEKKKDSRKKSEEKDGRKDETKRKRDEEKRRESGKSEKKESMEKTKVVVKKEIEDVREPSADLSQKVELAPEMIHVKKEIIPDATEMTTVRVGGEILPVASVSVPVETEMNQVPVVSEMNLKVEQASSLDIDERVIPIMEPTSIILQDEKSMDVDLRQGTPNMNPVLFEDLEKSEVEPSVAEPMLEDKDERAFANIEVETKETVVDVDHRVIPMDLDERVVPSIVADTDHRISKTDESDTEVAETMTKGDLDLRSPPWKADENLVAISEEDDLESRGSTPLLDEPSEPPRKRPRVENVEEKRWAGDVDVREQVADVDVRQDVDVRPGVKDVDVRQKVEDVDVRHPVEDIDARQQIKDVDARQGAEDVDVRQRVEDVDVRQQAEDVDVRQGAKDVDARKQPSVEEKDDLSDLFGGEDVDYRQPPKQLTLDISGAGGPKGPVPESPASVGWAKFKANHPDEFPFQQPNQMTPLKSPHAMRGQDVDMRTPPAFTDLSPQSSNALAMFRDSEMIIQQAEEQLRAGKISQIQYHELLQKLSELHKLQMIQREIRMTKETGEEMTSPTKLAPQAPAFTKEDPAEPATDVDERPKYRIPRRKQQEQKETMPEKPKRGILKKGRTADRDERRKRAQDEDERGRPVLERGMLGKDRNRNEVNRAGWRSERVDLDFRNEDWDCRPPLGPDGRPLHMGPDGKSVRMGHDGKPPPHWPGPSSRQRKGGPVNLMDMRLRPPPEIERIRVDSPSLDQQMEMGPPDLERMEDIQRPLKKENLDPRIRHPGHEDAGPRPDDRNRGKNKRGAGWQEEEKRRGPVKSDPEPRVEEVGKPVPESEVEEMMAPRGRADGLNYLPPHVDVEMLRRQVTELDPCQEVVIDQHRYQFQIGARQRQVNLFNRKFDLYVDGRTREVKINRVAQYRLGDPPREFKIAGGMHKIYFHGAMRRIWIDRVQYDIRLDAPPQRIVVKGITHDVKASTLDNVLLIDGISVGQLGSKPKTIKIALTKHELRYDPPPKEIVVDGERCKLKLNYPIPVIIIDGHPRGLCFDGKPREVLIDGKSFTIPMHEKRIVRIGGVRPHKIGFLGPGHELLIDNMTYECHFGGPPRDIMVSNRIHTVCLKGTPPELKILDRIPVDEKTGRLQFHPKYRSVHPPISDEPEQTIEDMPEEIPMIPPPVSGAPGQPPMFPGQPQMAPGQLPMAPGQPPMLPDQRPMAPGQLPPGQPPRPMIPGQPPMAPGQPPMAPGQPPMAPGQPPMAPGQPPMAPGQPQMAPGQPHQPMMLGQPPMVPGQPQMAPGQPQMAPGQPPMMPGQQQMALGQPQMAPGQPQMAPGQPQAAPGQPQMMPGQPPMMQPPMSQPGFPFMQQQPPLMAPQPGFMPQTSQPGPPPMNIYPGGMMPNNPVMTMPGGVRPAGFPGMGIPNIGAPMQPMMGLPQFGQMPGIPGMQPQQPAAPSVDIKELFSKLVQTGIIAKKKEEEEEAKKKQAAEEGRIIPVEIGPSESLVKVQPIPDMTNLKTDRLKQHHAGVVQRLYLGIQCSSCGIRFIMEEKDKYQEHLDWHFRQNKKEKDEMKIAKFRKWYYDSQDWIEFEEIQDVDARARKNFFARTLQASQGAGGCVFESNANSNAPSQGITSCPAASGDGDAGDVCEICADPFEQFWDEESEEWHLKDAIRVEGKIYHPVCYEDAKLTLLTSTASAMEDGQDPFSASFSSATGGTLPDSDTGADSQTKTQGEENVDSSVQTTVKKEPKDETDSLKKEPGTPEQPSIEQLDSDVPKIEIKDETNNSTEVKPSATVKTEPAEVPAEQMPEIETEIKTEGANQLEDIKIEPEPFVEQAMEPEPFVELAMEPEPFVAQAMEPEPFVEQAMMPIQMEPEMFGSAISVLGGSSVPISIPRHARVVIELNSLEDGEILDDS